MSTSRLAMSRAGEAVARTHPAAAGADRTAVHVALLTDKPGSHSDGTKRLAEELLARGAVVHTMDMRYLERTPAGTWLYQGQLAPSFDSVIAYHGAEMPESGLKVLRDLEDAGIWSTLGSRPAEVTRHKGKFAEWGAEHRLPVIPHIYARNRAAADQAIARWGANLIYKDPVGTKGEEVKGVTGIAEARATMNPDAPGMLQPRLNIRGADIRITTAQHADGRIVELLSAVRLLTPQGRAKGLVKTNFSQNELTGEELVTGHHIKPTKKQLRLAIAAHRALAREGSMAVAGVDVLTHWRTGFIGKLVDRFPSLRREYVAEVNNAPGNAEDLAPGIDMYGPTAQRAIDEGRRALTHGG